MTRKLTITVSDEVYAALHRDIGSRRIARFIERHIRLHLRLATDLERRYAEYEAYLDNAEGRDEAAEIDDWLATPPPDELDREENAWPEPWHDRGREG